MPEATNETLARLIEDGTIESYRIEGPRYTADSSYLGVVGISDHHSIFHAADFSGQLSPDSRFLLKKVQRPGDETRVFVLFRQFDSSPYQGSPEDLVAGWVPAEQEGQAQKWVDGMNAQIKEFGAAAASQRGAEAESVFTCFNVRTRFAGTAEQLVALVEPRLGCRFSPSTHWVYEGQPAFEAVSLGMIIRLVEFPPVGTYPRRFNLTGSPERPGLAYKERRDLSSDVQARLGDEGVEWYIPTRDELNTEAGF